MDPLTEPEFSSLMAPLGPFERRPRLAVAVSGGADSTALALLADAWARARGGAILALIVDHGLRADAAAEAEVTRQRLTRRGMLSRVLPLVGLARGSGLAARARAARYAALQAECAAEGVLHLLLGHHACDQAETVAMRRLAGSLPAGLAGMPALAETEHMRLLRPLLAIPPGRLRATLRAAGEGWVDDPSNADVLAQRARLRALRRDRDGIGPATRASVAAAAARGQARALRERAAAALLARKVSIAPESFAIVTPGGLPADALAALLRTLAGAGWAPSPAQVEALAAQLRPATLGGVRVLPAGKLRPGGWLLVREAAAMAPPQSAAADRWDGRFRLAWAEPPPAGAEIGALAADAGRLRDLSDLPSAVLQTLPAVRLHGKLVAAPGLGHAIPEQIVFWRAVFAPAVVLAGSPFLPASADRPGAASAQHCNPDTSVGMRRRRGHTIFDGWLPAG